MSALLEKVATLLDCIAVDWDTRKTAETPVVSPAVNPLALKYKEATGEELPADLAEKISADSQLSELFEKLPIFNAPNSFGGPSEKKAERSPSTKEEVREAAYDRFSSRILQHGQ